MQVAPFMETRKFSTTIYTTVPGARRQAYSARCPCIAISVAQAQSAKHATRCRWRYPDGCYGERGGGGRFHYRANVTQTSGTVSHPNLDANIVRCRRVILITHPFFGERRENRKLEAQERQEKRWPLERAALVD